MTYFKITIKKQLIIYMLLMNVFTQEELAIIYAILK